jgi:hypothetical protein
MKKPKKKSWIAFQKSRGTYVKPKKYKRKNIPQITLADFMEEKPKAEVVKKTAKELYLTFLKTKYWKKVRAMVFKRDNKTCQKCGSKKKIQAHHLTYENHKNELNHLEDLITLCEDCHKKEHNLK